MRCEQNRFRSVGHPASYVIAPVTLRSTPEDREHDQLPNERERAT